MAVVHKKFLRALFDGSIEVPIPKAVFDGAEYDRRIARTREWMTERGLDALFMSNPANIDYLTGYDGQSFYVHQDVVATRDHDEPVWVGRGMNANGIRTTTTLNGESIRPYSDDHVQSPHDLYPMDFIAAVLEDLGVDDARINLEIDACYFTAKSYTRLQKNLVEASFEDTTLLVNRVRIKKSGAELDYMCEAVRIFESAVQTGLGVIKTGVLEYKATEAICLVLIEGTDDYDGDYPSIVPLMPSGDHTDTPHLTWTDREFEDGNPVIIELPGCRHRYHSPFAQTTFVDGPPEELSWRADIVVGGMEATLGTIIPGMTCETVGRTWHDTIAQYGIEKKDRIGYSMGLGYPPGWGEHTASLRPDDEIILKENMAFHTIPGLWFDDFGVGLSETFVVTSDGAEPLTDFPRRLFTT